MVGSFDLGGDMAFGPIDAGSSGTDPYRRMAQLEKYYADQQKRQRAQHQDELDRLSTGYQNQRAQDVEETERTIHQIRQTNEEVRAQHRDRDLEDRVHLRDTYNRQIQDTRQTAQDELSEQMGKIQKDTDDQQQSLLHRRSRELEQSDQVHRQSREAAAEQYRRMAEQQRSHASEHLAETRQAQRDQLRQIQERSEESARIPTVSAEQYRHDTEALEQSAQAQAERRRNSAERQQEDALDRRDGIRQAQQEDQQAIRAQLRTEAADRLQNQQLSTRTEQAELQRHEQARALESDRNERTHQGELLRLQDQADREVAHLKAAQSRQQNQLSSRVQDLAQSQKGATQELLRQRTVETDTELARQRRSFEENLRHQNQAHDQNLARAQAQLNDAHNQGALERAIALEQQKSTARADAFATRQVEQGRINELEEQLIRQKSDTSVAEINPEAAAKIRAATLKTYQDLMDLEVERNKTRQTRLQEKFNEDYRLQSSQIARQEQEVARAQYAQLQEERERFLRQLDTMGFEDEQRTAAAEGQLRKISQTLKQSKIQALADQEFAYRNNLELQQERSNQLLNDEREEHHLETQKLQREANLRLSEQARQYEKQLADVRAQAQAEYADLKSLSAQERDQLERRTRTDLEAQSKAFERRITELTAQHQERERVAAENHDDEIARIRRNYEYSSHAPSQDRSHPGPRN